MDHAASKRLRFVALALAIAIAAFLLTYIIAGSDEAPPRAAGPGPRVVELSKANEVVSANVTLGADVPTLPAKKARPRRAQPERPRRAVAAPRPQPEATPRPQVPSTRPTRPQPEPPPRRPSNPPPPKDPPPKIERPDPPNDDDGGGVN